MVDKVIKISNLSKRYVIYHQRNQRYNTLRDSLVTNLKNISSYFKSFYSGNTQRTKSAVQEEFWALNDISLEVLQGERIGVIGRNGAGKSTLLKILSRITDPTRGRIQIHGRVASLLEVGTGFHPELTGRENIYLNGAILGMRRDEIRRKLDEIVEFAEVEQFIDTPVKRYSSGMYMRLAFAVAAHLEPDILIIDEVLAVGDLSFQKKSIGKISEVAKGERTVLFVSHNMAVIKALCNRAILLDQGRIVYNGDVNEAVNIYLRENVKLLPTGHVANSTSRLGNGEGFLRHIEMVSAAGESISQLYFGQSFRLSLTFEVLENIKDAIIEAGISTLDGIRIASSFTTDGEQPPLVLSKGWHKVNLELKTILLPGTYTFDVGIHRTSGLTIDYVERILEFTVLNVAEQGTDRYLWNSVRGFIRPFGYWHPPELIIPSSE